ncbi:MAG: glycosyltransferase family 4 protein [Microcoleus sp.]
MVHFNIGFQHFNSFADITLSLAKTLDKMGIPVSVEPSEIAPHVARICTASENRLLAKWMERNPSELFQLKWSHYWKPYFLKEIEGHLNLEFFAINYEFAKNDAEFDYWIYDAVHTASHKLAVSEFSKNVLIQAGCSPDNISVLPLGFNPSISEMFVSEALKEDRPLPTQPKPIKSIFHMTNSFDLYRFGTDLAIQAFCEEFYGEWDVELFIKDGGKHPELLGNLITNNVDRFGKSCPKIRVVRQVFTKQELAALYLSADAFLAPFRGEGFAIKILDAFAAGLPVAMTMYGGPTDYANSTNCYPIEFDLVPVGKCYDTQYLNIQNEPHWAEPKVQSVREQLRNIVADPRRFAVAQKARATANLFSWEVTAQKLLKLMRQLF